MRTSADVVVVGGGPAGLTAALLAARAGWSVTLIEASDRLGGMAASTMVAGQRVDLGSHRLHPSAGGPTRALLEELLGEDLQVRPRRGRLRLDGRWIGFPLRAGELVRQLPPTTAAAIGRDLMFGPLRREHARDSYADVVRARLGPTVLNRFHGPYAHKVWGVPAEELAGDLARRRIALTGGSEVVRRLVRSGRPAGRTFLYPRRGYGQIVERLAEAGADAGVEFRLGTRPSALRAHRQHPVVMPGEEEAVDAGRVLWTAPPQGLLSAAGPPGSPATTLRHRGVVLCYLALDRAQYTPYDAHYVPDVAVPFVRLSEPKNYRDGPDPADRTVLCAEIPSTPGDAVWAWTDHDAAVAVRDGIARLGLPPVQNSQATVIRLPKVYPAYSTTQTADLEVLLARAELVPGVTLLGRQGLAVTDNLHHVMDMAHAAVGCLRQENGGAHSVTAPRWDQDAWRRARAGFEAHVVED